MRQTTPTVTMTAETPIATFFPATLFSKSRARERVAQHATATAAWKTPRKFCKFILIAVPARTAQGCIFSGNNGERQRQFTWSLFL
jgi:hypothetical protein